jgi:type I restriction enzyme M protein
MANPPFNVDEVELDQVKSQPRFNTYGVPQNKTKKSKGDAKETVPNANYLWINLFATSLNKDGRAALVMANSASDAGHSEKEARIKLIESGIISQMVTLPTNMFTSVTLPATLWFFNNAKQCKDEILFIDARNIFTQIDRAHRKFSDEQIKNLAIITRLYEGKTDELTALLGEYRTEFSNAPENSDDEDVKPKAYWQEQIDWLTSRFPDGKYVDVVGLCKAAKLEGEDGIKDQDYSLNPGRYVGVVIEDDGMTEEEFKAAMRALGAEFAALNSEARKLEAIIADNLKELVGEDE